MQNPINKVLQFNRPTTWLAVAFICVLVANCFILHETESVKYPDRIYGKPIVSTEYPEIALSIEQVVDDGHFMYILYHHSNGIVQVCDLEGEYLYTVFFYCHMNGGFSLAIEDSRLYVQDMRNNVYIFYNGEFESFIERKDAEKQFSHIDFRKMSSSSNYEVVSGAIWKITEHKRICIVNRPSENQVSLQSLLPSLIAVLLCIHLSHRYYVKKH